MWLGNSHHHMDFPGTVSAEPRVWLDLLCGLVDNFITHGFRRIVVLNGHGGNDVPGRQATFELRQKHRERADLLLLFATYWNLADPTSEHLWFVTVIHAARLRVGNIDDSSDCTPKLVKDHQNTPRRLSREIHFCRLSVPGLFPIEPRPATSVNPTWRRRKRVNNFCSCFPMVSGTSYNESLTGMESPGRVDSPFHLNLIRNMRK